MHLPTISGDMSVFRGVIFSPLKMGAFPLMERKILLKTTIFRGELFNFEECTPMGCRSLTSTRWNFITEKQAGSAMPMGTVFFFFPVSTCVYTPVNWHSHGKSTISMVNKTTCFLFAENATTTNCHVKRTIHWNENMSLRRNENWKSLANSWSPLHVHSWGSESKTSSNRNVVV